MTPTSTESLLPGICTTMTRASAMNARLRRMRSLSASRKGSMASPSPKRRVWRTVVSAGPEVQVVEESPQP